MSDSMAVIAVTSLHQRNATKYMEAIERAQGQVRLLLPPESHANLFAALVERAEKRGTWST